MYNQHLTLVTPKTINDARGLTTFHIGGELKHFVEVDSLDQLGELVEYLKVHKLNFKILGAGSNLLIPDGEFADWVIKLGKGFRYTNKKADNIVEVGAASSLMNLSRDLSQAGLSGLEFAAGIPASVGGAVKMNAGAHAGEISQVLDAVEVFDCNQNKLVRILAAQLKFSYRKVSLDPNFIVLKAEFRLKMEDPQVVMDRRRAALEYRKQTQPLTLPSAGSIFKNPSPIPSLGQGQSAGYLIENCDLKGYKIGGASISKMHANWIVNQERQATAQDVKALISYVQKVVFEKFGIMLEPELVCW